MRKVETSEEAIRLLSELRAEVSEPRRIEAARLTFDVLLAEFLRAKPGKPEWYLDPLRQFFGNRLVRSITYATLREFREAREAVPSRLTGEPRKAATINREVEVLRSVLLYAHRHGWIERNPFTAGDSLVERAAEERRTRVPTPAEEARLLLHCTGPRAYLRPLIIATRDTGLRRSALRSIRWQDVDLEQGIIRVPPPPSRWKRRPRVVVLTARLREELAALQDSPDPKAPVFFGGDFKRAWSTLCRLAGVEDLRFNDFRHGFATDMLEAGVEQRLAMLAAGHNNAETHAIYTNIDTRLSRQIADALDRLHASREIAPDNSYVN